MIQDIEPVGHVGCFFEANKKHGKVGIAAKQMRREENTSVAWLSRYRHGI